MKSSILSTTVNTLKLRQNGHHFAESIFISIFFNENNLILIKISLKFAFKDPIDNRSALIPTMAEQATSYYLNQ